MTITVFPRLAASRRRALRCVATFPLGALVLGACTADHEPQNPVAAHTQPAPTTSPDQPVIHFSDVTSQTGIDMIMTCGDQNTPPMQREILEVNGGGLGLLDYDNDGDLDLFVANGATLADPEHGPGCRLYQNLGALRFRDVTTESGIDLRRWAMGVAVGDYDGDRLDDLYVCCCGPNVLLRNTGDGRFIDVTQAAGLYIDQPLNWSTSAAFGDVDNDNDLDLYVCNYLEFDVNRRPPHTKYKGVEVMAGPHGLKAQHDRLYENQGDGTFRDITQEAGCLPPSPAYGLNLVIIDFDNDGWQDITVANDSMAGFLFRNLGVKDGHARFEEIGVLSGLAANADGANQAAMGLAIADVDDNGFPDKFTTVFSSDTNALHMNIDGRFFEDRSQQYGLAMISRPFLGWSTAFYDFDHDGDEDLFMVNGHVYPNATMESMDSDYLQTPLLFERDGKRFKRVTPEVAGSWLAEKHRDRNAVFADFDHDGDIDIIVGELNGPIRVLRNDLLPLPLGEGRGEGDSNWLIVELRDDRPQSKNHRGLGSKVELITGDAKQTRWLFTGGGFQSSGAPYAHFGISSDWPASNTELLVTWSNGLQQRINDVQLNRRMTITRGE